LICRLRPAGLTPKRLRSAWAEILFLLVIRSSGQEFRGRDFYSLLEALPIGSYILLSRQCRELSDTSRFSRSLTETQALTHSCTT
jgi:hypothetical protein